MIYRRQFTLTSCHFNDNDTYGEFFRAVTELDPPAVRADRYRRCLAATHGHNFQIEVVVEGWPSEGGILIDDVELAAVVLEWDNTNLSVHSDFLNRQERATTENIARRLAEKIGRLGKSSFIVKVTVHETPQIAATATWHGAAQSVS